MLIVLKLPILAMLGLVYWASRQQPSAGPDDQPWPVVVPRRPAPQPGGPGVGSKLPINGSGLARQPQVNQLGKERVSMPRDPVGPTTFTDLA